MGGVSQKEAIEAVRSRITEDTPFWAEKFAKIVDKQGKRIPFEMNEGQLEFDAALEAQRAAGQPMRIIALKARQVGISTVSQAKLIHRATLREHYNCVTVAHDRGTGQKLYRMGETMWANLPEDKRLGIKPDAANFRRGQFMRFGGASREDWARGNVFPDSEYLVDTAGEFQAGRGGTYRGMHLSELAFWAQIGFKMTALMSAVPDDSESLVMVESTPNGHNEFKDLWDDAMEGRSDFHPFFWPWWKHLEYQLAFANETERERFIVGEGAYGEEEPDLVRDYGLTLEQLQWRRRTIANKCGGDLRIFHQEYPATPEQSFLSSGQKTFDPYRIAGLIREADQTDPRQTSPDNPGPEYGEFTIGSTKHEEGRTGDLEIPNQALWVPWSEGPKNQPWRFWPDWEADTLPVAEYVIGSDVSGGQMESTDEPDYQTIQVINHATKQQVAEYQSRVEPDELALQILLAALYFKDAVVAVERTGGWGLPVLRKLLHEFHYWNLYKSRRVGGQNEKADKKLGWDTNTRTKPILISGMQVRLREDDYAGIKSRRLASEANTYIRDEKGRSNAAPKAFDDLLIAYMIAQFVASERPLMESGGSDPGGTITARSTLSSYDPRYG